MQSPNPLGDFSIERNALAPTMPTVPVAKHRGCFLSLSRGLQRLHENMAVRTKAVPRTAEAYPAFGRALSDTEVADFLPPERFITIDIPDEGQDNIKSKYPSNSLVDSDTPEQIASRKVHNLNVVDIDEDALETFKKVIADSTTELTSFLCDDIIAPFIAIDNATAIATATARDGLGVNAVIDTSFISAYEELAKLAAIDKLATRLNLSESTRQTYMVELSRLFAARSVEVIDKKTKSDFYSSILRNLQAQVGTSSPGIDKNPMALVKTRNKN